MPNVNHSPSQRKPGVQDVIDRLKSRGLIVRQTGDGWQCQCPSHDDRSPSLSIHESQDGRLLVHCFSGCSFETILKALGFETYTIRHGSATLDGKDRDGVAKALKKPRKPKPKKPRTLPGLPENQYIYRDEKGAVIFAVVRQAKLKGKTFSQWTPAPDSKGLWIPRALKAPRPLYRLPELLQSEGRVVVVEGEKCVEAAARHFPDYTFTTWAGGYGFSAPLGLDPARRP